MSVKFTDNSVKILKAMEKAKHNALTAIGMAVETNAKLDAGMPVDTGYARNSITYAVAGGKAGTSSYQADRAKGDQPIKKGKYSGTMEGEEDEFVAIGSNVPYFQVIELGGQNRKAHHILKKAATEHSAEYKRLAEDAVYSAINNSQ